jgi:hypothetical protein
VALLHGLTGLVLGFLLGWYLWTRWQLRAWGWIDAKYLDSWEGFAIVVLGPSILFGILGACLKERFWEDWHCPFWWRWW